MSGSYVLSVHPLSDKKLMTFLAWYRVKASVFSNSAK